MPIESAKLFIERMKNDDEFAQKVTGCKDAEARMELVKTAGYDFTIREVKEASCELSDEEAAMIVGGAGYFRCKGTEEPGGMLPG